jgi:Fe-S-cluster-containing dehydrogenase component
MTKKRLMLDFPTHLLDQPVTCELTRKYDLDVAWHRERCIQCTACTSACPTGALSVQRPEMIMSFDQDRCMGCGLCEPVCPYRAMEVVC